jgi:hypothetical protein
MKTLRIGWPPYQFTDFEDYAGLLSGAPPEHVFQFDVLQQRQTWKLREYHLLEADPDPCGNPPQPSSGPVPALGDGNPLFAFFPGGTEVREDGNILRVQEPGRRGELHYVRGDHDALQRNNDATSLRVLDIIVLGEVSYFHFTMFCDVTHRTPGACFLGNVSPSREGATL